MQKSANFSIHWKIWQVLFVSADRLGNWQVSVFYLYLSGCLKRLGPIYLYSICICQACAFGLFGPICQLLNLFAPNADAWCVQIPAHPRCMPTPETGHPVCGHPWWGPGPTNVAALMPWWGSTNKKNGLETSFVLGGCQARTLGCGPVAWSWVHSLWIHLSWLASQSPSRLPPELKSWHQSLENAGTQTCESRGWPGLRLASPHPWLKARDLHFCKST